MSQLLEHLPILVILFPLIATLLCPLISHFNSDWGKRTVISALFIAAICAGLQLWQVVKTGEAIHYYIGGWPPIYGIEFVVDGLSGVIILLVAIASWITALFSSPFERLEREELGAGSPSGSNVRSSGYYSMLSFLSLGLLGMASTGDAFNLYVFMEITAISGYGLIAVGESKGPIAAFRYLLIGTIGACMYLMGAGFLYAATGTLNMEDLSRSVAELGESPLIIFAVACMIIGFGIKMALFPLHGWQPAAHSYAHPGADPMIAGIMIKVPAYAMLRFFFFVFLENTPVMDLFFDVIGVLAVCGVLFGSLKALRYETYNKILAYSSIGQVGYIAMGFAIGNYYGLVGAVLHIVSHAFMKSGLFYTSGSLKYKYGIHEITQLGQVYRDMPVTSMAMVVCALSMVGLPPFAGFFSKWYLALGAIENGQYLFVAVLILSSLLSAIYFFRVFEKMFMESKTVSEREDTAFLAKKGSGKGSGSGRLSSGKSHFELPWQLLIPMVIVILAIILIGLFNSYIVGDVIGPTLKEVALL